MPMSSSSSLSSPVKGVTAPLPGHKEPHEQLAARKRSYLMLLLRCLLVLALCREVIAWNTRSHSPPHSSVTPSQTLPLSEVAVRGDGTLPPTPLPYTTGKKCITLAASLALPEIEAAALANTFPSISVSYVTINKMHMESFSIKSLKVAMATPSADNVTVNVADLKLTIPDTEFTFKYSFLKCPGVFRLRLNATQFSFNVHPSVTDEVLSISIGAETTNITWGDLSIEHDLDTVLCRIGQSIVQVFVGQMDELIEKNIKEQLPVMLPQNLRDKANEALSSSGLRFSAPLQMTPDRATGQVELILREDVSPPPSASLVVPAGRGLPDLSDYVLPYRDAAAVLLSSSINNFLAHARDRNLLNATILLPDNVTSESLKDVFPAAHALCPDCSVGLGLAATTAPMVTFRKADSAARLQLWNVYAGIYFIPRSSLPIEAVSRVLSFLGLTRGDVTRGHNAFPLFRNSPYCHSLGHWHKFINCLEPSLRLDAMTAVPVVAFSVNATLGVGNLSSVGAKRNSVQYEILPIEDLSFKLLATTFAPVDVDKFTEDVRTTLNDIVIPLANLDSPISVPGPIKEILIDVQDDSLTAGLNISFF